MNGANYNRIGITGLIIGLIIGLVIVLYDPYSAFKEAWISAKTSPSDPYELMSSDKLIAAVEELTSRTLEEHEFAQSVSLSGDKISVFRKFPDAGCVNPDVVSEETLQFKLTDFDTRPAAVRRNENGMIIWRAPVRDDAARNLVFTRVFCSGDQQSGEEEGARIRLQVDVQNQQKIAELLNSYVLRLKKKE